VIPIYAAIALSGMAALGAEVVWTRLLSLLLAGTTYTFSIILAVFLVGLALGSAGGAALARRVADRPPPWPGVRSSAPRHVGMDSLGRHEQPPELVRRPVGTWVARRARPPRSRPVLLGDRASDPVLGGELPARSRGGPVLGGSVADARLVGRVCAANTVVRSWEPSSSACSP
jgi:hypothetical protein